MIKYRSSRLAQKKRKEFLINLFLIIGLLLSVIYLFSELSKIGKINIDEIKVEGNDFIDSKELIKLVEKNLSDYYFFGIFPKSNILIYPRNELKINILNSLSRVKDVDLNLDLPNLLNVKIFEYEPYALWCKDFKDDNCFLIDKNGYIFDEYINSPIFDYIKYYTYLESSESIRQVIIEREKFKEIDSFVKFLEGLNLKPYKLVINRKGKVEIYFDDGKKIIFDNEQNIREVMDNFQALMGMEEFVNEGIPNNLEYIDLRFGNKVFYK